MISSLLSITILGAAQAIVLVLILLGLIACFIPFSKMGIKEGIVSEDTA